MDACFEKWLWIDLIGFDMAQEDCGVASLLNKVGSPPEIISLLLQNAEFVHRHEGADGRRPFPPDVCSYGGHPSNEERQRQAWTPVALKRLIGVLHTQGVRVVFSVFDSGSPDGWREHHPEIGYVRRSGERTSRICPWKRLADGTLYEDFFLRKLREVVRDYGFDGFHGADGYSHPRFPLHDADFSDDMVAQFMAHTGERLPAHISADCRAESADETARADWIWAERRCQWIEFHTQRIQQTWRKMAAMLHDEGKILALNTAWTRDPYESIYRFGTDYQALAAVGVDAFVVEAAGAVQELGGDLPYGTAYGTAWDGWDPGRILCRFQTTIMSIKAAAPEVKLVFLNGVKDTNEIWNGLRHAPTNLESEITMHGNVFLRRRSGQLERCTKGPVVCLADGIRPDEWRWLNEVWQRAFEWPAHRVPGATVVWSDTVLERHHEHYTATRDCPPGRLLFELVSRGAPLYAIQRVADLGIASEPLVILHPQLYAEDELARVFAHARGPVFLIGRKGEYSAAAPVAEGWGAAGPEALWCGVYGLAPEAVHLPETPREVGRAEDPARTEEPPSWIYELPSHSLPSPFLSACAAAITAASGAPRVVENADSVRVWAVEAPSGTLRLFVRNDSFYYRVARVDMRRAIASIRVRTEFPGKPIPFDGAFFHVKIPGKGVVIADIELI